MIRLLKLALITGFPVAKRSCRYFSVICFNVVLSLTRSRPCLITPLVLPVSQYENRKSVVALRCWEKCLKTQLEINLFEVYSGADVGFWNTSKTDNDSKLVREHTHFFLLLQYLNIRYKNTYDAFWYLIFISTVDAFFFFSISKKILKLFVGNVIEILRYIVDQFSIYYEN